ncbi:MAG: stage II sporulation protein M [Candidatus Thorarchaeota archaeon]
MFFTINYIKEVLDIPNMALESLVKPSIAAKNIKTMFFIGFLYASIALFLSTWIFRSHASLVMVFLTVIASIPFMYKTMKMEENYDVKLKKEFSILKEHFLVLKGLLALFIGYVLAYSFWFIVLPSGTVQTLFTTQLETINVINNQISGAAVSSNSVFFQILLNNMKVLLFCLFFSFFYGAGAIFILTWNASVISAAIGTFVKEKLAALALAVGIPSVFHYFQFFSLGILRYAIHGIPEIAAYFIGGLAGGIISVAMVNRHLEGSRFSIIMRDAFDLGLIAVIILIIAAFLEVYITPIFF